jgi:hypothetical protein
MLGISLSAKKSLIRLTVAPLTLRKLILLPWRVLTSGLRCKNPSIQCLPRGLSSPCSNSRNEAISLTFVWVGGNPIESWTRIYFVKRASWIFESRCWVSASCCCVLRPSIRIRRVIRGIPHRVAAVRCEQPAFILRIADWILFSECPVICESNGVIFNWKE